MFNLYKWAFVPFFFMKVVCYNFETHSYLGNVLENYLQTNDTEMLYNVKSILLEPLGNASIWADRVKFQKEYAWTRQLHYIDILECNKNKDINDITVDHYCENKCITSALQNFTTTLKNQIKESEIIDSSKQWCTIQTPKIELHKRELFKFILHFLQDFNQPMHLMGFDRGGNSYQIIRNKNGRNKTTNLHALWDSELPQYFIQKHGPYKPNKVKIQKITTQNEYKDMLIQILNKNLNITCSKLLNDRHYIIFEEYFNENEIRLLFDNYIYLAVNTLNYIWLH